MFGFGKKFKCDTCGAKFSTEAELKEHAKMHMQPMSGSGSMAKAAGYKCDACGMTFATQAELMEHSKRAHQKM
ncbi:MAG: C2H2-type zinc finger protein [Thaumarchaeota archaeon]|nr:C2H2-type zinc finger protein [Nitrososphaerota archaeon]